MVECKYEIMYAVYRMHGFCTNNAASVCNPYLPAVLAKTYLITKSKICTFIRLQSCLIHCYKKYKKASYRYRCDDVSAGAVNFLGQAL